MEVLLDMLWDYRRGFYVSERYAPLRYRARRFLEKRVIPATRKIGLALAAAAVVAFFAFLTLLERVGGLAEEALTALVTVPYRAIARRIAWWTAGWAREPWEFMLASVILFPALAAFAGAVVVAFALAGIFLLAGKAAERVKAALG